MKSSAVVRIIIWSIVALLLLSVLIAALSGGLFGSGGWNWNFFGLNGGGSYSSYDDSRYTAGNGGVDASDVRDIAIDWVAGSVTVVPADGDEIRFEEHSDRELTDDYVMRYRLEGGTLRIRYARSRVSFFGLFRSMSKDLTVYLPRGLVLDVLSVDSVSASVDAEQIRAEEIDVETVSGALTLSDADARGITMESVSGAVECGGCAADTVNAETVSGRIRLEGDFGTVDTESVSGSAEVRSGRMPLGTRMDSVSGSITLVLPENDGFTARYDKVSGGFGCEFDAELSKNSAVYKDGSASVRFGTVSGSMNIRRG